MVLFVRPVFRAFGGGARSGALGFIIRASHSRCDAAGWRHVTGGAVTNVNSCWFSISRISSLHNRR